jgi:hypothetical protein
MVEINPKGKTNPPPVFEGRNFPKIFKKKTN